MSKNKEVTGKKAASAAGKVLSNPKSTKAEKSAAASVLSQVNAPTKVTSSKAASLASKTLSSNSSGKSAKSAAASALTQRPNKK